MSHLVIKQLTNIKKIFLSRSFKKKFKKYSEFTMIPEEVFLSNLMLVNSFKSQMGCVVECGVWRGGMIASISEILGKDRDYFLFDSFEGLPKAKEIDGVAATNWQKNKESPFYYDNCKAEINYAEKAMKMAGQKNFHLIKGWFSETLPFFKPDQRIAILRLDGDWYDSTMDCLKNLYPLVKVGGIVIIDDYYVWDGCSKAVHDFLSMNKLSEKIYSNGEGLCYIIRK